MKKVKKIKLKLKSVEDCPEASLIRMVLPENDPLVKELLGSGAWEVI